MPAGPDTLYIPLNREAEGEEGYLESILYSLAGPAAGPKIGDGWPLLFYGMRKGPRYSIYRF